MATTTTEPPITYTGYSIQQAVELNALVAKGESDNTAVTQAIALTNANLTAKANELTFMIVENKSKAESDDAVLRASLSNLNAKEIQDIEEVKTLITNLTNKEVADVISLSGQINALANLETTHFNNVSDAVSSVSASLASLAIKESGDVLNINNNLAILNGSVASLQNDLSAQIATQLSGQAYDALQVSIINQAVSSLQNADSNIYNSIAQKASIMSENASNDSLRKFVTAFLGAFNLSSTDSNGLLYNYVVSDFVNNNIPLPTTTGAVVPPNGAVVPPATVPPV